MLYSKNGTVYIGARSTKRANVGIKTIEAAHRNSRGRLVSMVLDLADLSTIKPAVERFLAMEDRLHILVHNAGVMMPPAGSKTKLVSLRVSRGINLIVWYIFGLANCFCLFRGMISRWERIV